MATTNELYIQKELIPYLVSNGKLTQNKKIATKINPTIKNVSVKQLNTKESFMLTMCYRVEVQLEEDGKDYKYYLIVKKTPKVPDEMYDATGFDSLFSNEITAYTTTLPAMGDMSKYVKYYYSYRKEHDAMIVLEDFSVNGWKMSESRYNLSLEHVLLAVQTLGRFHGQGYALKLTQPEKFHSLVDMFQPSRFGTDPPESWNHILKQSFKRYCKIIDESELPALIPYEFLDKLKEISQDYIEMAKNVFKPVEPFATICHGDYLRNNIAYKYDEQSKDPKKPVNVIMFDFQTVIYTSPMMDLATFLALSAGSDCRSENFDQVLKAYWDALIENVCKSSGLDANSLPDFMSYDSMIREYIKNYPYGIRIATFFLMEMIAPQELSPEDFTDDIEVIEKLFNPLERGGEAVNKEIRSMVLELYNMCQQYEVDLFGHYDMLKDL